MKTKISEAEVKREIIQYLNLRGYFVWNNRNTGLYDSRRGKWIPAVLKGIPDIIGIQKTTGIFIGIEVKRPDYKKDGSLVNQPTIFQSEFINNINKYNGIGIIVSSLDECIERLKL